MFGVELVHSCEVGLGNKLGNRVRKMLLDMDEVVMKVEEQEEMMIKTQRKVVHWRRIDRSRAVQLDFNEISLSPA